MRDLRTEIQDKVLKGINKLGTVNIACVYQKMLQPTYLDGNATNAVESSTNISIIISDFNSSKSSSTFMLKDDEAIKDGDMVAIFSTRLLPFAPTIKDIIVDDKLVEWSVLGVTGDPAYAHWELHIRPLDNE